MLSTDNKVPIVSGWRSRSNSVGHGSNNRENGNTTNTTTVRHRRRIRDCNITLNDNNVIEFNIPCYQNSSPTSSCSSSFVRSRSNTTTSCSSSEKIINFPLTSDNNKTFVYTPSCSSNGATIISATINTSYENDDDESIMTDEEMISRSPSRDAYDASPNSNHVLVVTGCVSKAKKLAHSKTPMSSVAGQGQFYDHGGSSDDNNILSLSPNTVKGDESSSISISMGSSSNSTSLFTYVEDLSNPNPNPNPNFFSCEDLSFDDVFDSAGTECVEEKARIISSTTATTTTAAGPTEEDNWGKFHEGKFLHSKPRKSIDTGPSPLVLHSERNRYLNPNTNRNRANKKLLTTTTEVDGIMVSSKKPLAHQQQPFSVGDIQPVQTDIPEKVVISASPHPLTPTKSPTRGIGAAVACGNGDGSPSKSSLPLISTPASAVKNKLPQPLKPLQPQQLHQPKGYTKRQQELLNVSTTTAAATAAAATVTATLAPLVGLCTAESVGSPVVDWGFFASE
jgi:hypothetical protein